MADNLQFSVVAGIRVELASAWSSLHATVLSYLSCVGMLALLPPSQSL